MFDAPDGEPRADGSIQTVTSADLDNSFHVHVPRIKDAIFTDLVGRGLYRSRPDRTSARYYMLAAIIGWPIFAICQFVLPESKELAVVIGLGTVFIIALFSYVMPARTVAGARTRDRVRGLEEVLRRVDAHRLESLPLTPELSEKFLPYAVALGVERRWARAFAGICTQPPGWYVGPAGDGSFDPGGFADRDKATPLL